MNWKQKLPYIVLLGLIAFDLLMICFYLNLGGKMFDLDAENNLPTLYQTLKLALASGVGFALFLVSKVRQEKIAWGFLAVMFGYLTIDEWSQVHEVVSGITDHILLNSIGRVSFSAWIVAFAPIMLAALVALYYIYKKVFLQEIYQKHRLHLWFVIGMFAIALVPVFEVIGTIGWDFQSAGNRLWISIEEGLEMLSISMFLSLLVAVFFWIQIDNSKRER